MDIFLTVILITLVCLLLYKYMTRNFNYWKEKNVFYLNPVPFFGNMLSVLAMKNTLGEWLWDHYDAIDKDFFGIFVFGQPVLVVKSPKLVKAILQKDFTVFDDRTVANSVKDPVMANLMFFQKNPMWKNVRSKLTPVFTSGKLKLMFPIILKESESMIKYIETIAYISNVESKEICAKYSTNVIAKCAFAVDARSFENEDAEFRKIGREMFGFRITTAMRQFGSWFMPNLFQNLDIHFIDPKLVKSLRNIFTQVLHSRMESSELKGHDLIDILLEGSKNNQNKGFSEEAILGQAIQFFGAGFETVSSSLSFALYEICIQPKIQDRLRNEILSHINQDKGITYEGIFEMNYLDMCVLEALRKYPVLPFLDRRCKADYKVDDLDFVIEKGTPIYIPMFGLHYDPKYFPDPKKYDPERFADKTVINKDGLYYIPFGEGQRMCIGNRFAMMVVKIGLISILAKFKLEKSDQTPIPIRLDPMSIILQSTVGVPLRFVPI